MYTDFLLKIRNAKGAEKPTLKTPTTALHKAIADLLAARGFIKSVEVKGKGPKKYLEIEHQTNRPIHGIKFLSTPSLHRYGGYKDFRKVKGGFGMLVVSTSKGIMNGEAARKEKAGGELLFEIW